MFRQQSINVATLENAWTRYGVSVAQIREAAAAVHPSRRVPRLLTTGDAEQIARELNRRGARIPLRVFDEMTLTTR